jgi:hypothetical protein
MLCVLHNSDLALHAHLLARAIRSVSKNGLMPREGVLAVLGEAALLEEEASAVVSYALAHDILREDGDRLSVEHAIDGRGPVRR